MKKRACLYTRVPEISKPIRLEKQTDKCRQLAEKYKCDPLFLIQDIIDERRAYKPGLEKVKEIINNSEVDALITDNVQSLYRDRHNLLMFLRLCSKHGVVVISSEGIITPSQYQQEPIKKGVQQIL